MKTTFKKFEGLWAFEKYLNENDVQPNYKESYNQASQRKEEGFRNWYGTHSWTEAQTLFAHGDSATAKEITSGVLDTLKNNKRTVAKIETAVVGCAPHVPNFIAGRPNAMIRLINVPKKASVVTIIYNMSVNAGVSPENIKQAAVKTLSAIKMLEDSGTRVNLYICDISERNNEQIGWTLKIKTASQHLDILKTAYPLCHPSMLRRHSFRFTEVTPQNFGICEYGRAVYDTTDICKKCGIRDAVSLTLATVGRKDAKELAEYIITTATSKKRH